MSRATGRTHRVAPALVATLCLLLAGIAFAAVQAARPSPTHPPARVMLVGGAGHEAPGRHEYALGLARLADWLRADGMQVRVLAEGWPADASVLEQADAIILYFDGADAHPLADATRRNQLSRLAARGVGLVVLHQASTTPAADELGLGRLFGATRPGLFDRSTEWAALAPVGAAHPVLNGVRAFEYRDEFYPTLRVADAAQLTPLLDAPLHPQYRDGAPWLSDAPETRMVAWAQERGPARAVGYTGLHFLAAFDEPMLQRFLRNAVAWTAHQPVPPGGMPIDTPMPPPQAAGPHTDPAATTQALHGTVPVATFQQDRSRSGWYRAADAITSDTLARERLGLAWESLPFDAADGTPARLYASPLYLEGVAISRGPERGRAHDIVLVATNLGEVLAINARRDGDLAPGRVLWRHAFGAPCHLQPAPLDGVPTGILATPVVDRARGVVYVTHCDEARRWQAHALALGSGVPLAGWPVTLDEPALNAVNANAGPSRVAPTRKHDFRVQRGALNLSPDGTRLYVVFGETETGWLVSVDTLAPRLHGAFAAVAMPHRGSGGIWGAGGPAVDADGRVFVVTGSGFGGWLEQPHDWTQSVLAIEDTASGLRLRGTYTPFNHCRTAAMDIDLGSGGAMLFDLPAQAGAAPARLLALGGKQGNAYLLARDRLPGRLDTRPPCSDDASRDGSLLAPGAQPQFGTRGPLSLFGPYSDKDAALDLARARSLPAMLREPDSSTLLFFTGNTKAAEGSATSVPASLVRVRVQRAGAGDPWLAVEERDAVHVFGNPGSPTVSSRADGGGAVVWVLDENAPRSAALTPAADAPQPVLYALDARSLRELWRSAPGELATSGKYNAPAFGAGLVFVGTDRLQAFGPGGHAQHMPERGRFSHVGPAQPAPTAPPAAATPSGTTPTSADGQGAAQAWTARCAACHDQAQGNIPPRAVLATYARERIVHALTDGIMRPHAAGLDAAQIGALADFVRAGDGPADPTRR
jgi:hypothetical protein